MDACYYTLIRRLPDGRFAGWVPDLPGVRANGLTEEAVLRLLTRGARDFLHELVMRGVPLPAPSTDSDLTAEGGAIERRLLLILS